MQPEEQLVDLIEKVVIARSLKKAVFSSPRTTDCQFTRVDVRPILVKGETWLQFTSQTATQQFHQNLDWQQAQPELIRLATVLYRNTNFITDSQNIEAKFSRKGKCLLRETKLASHDATQVPSEIPSHNRVRKHILQDGIVCPFLVETGIMSASGQVLASHAKKFKQINRFLEFILDIADHLPKDRVIHVVDFGCGKSYLTFATQHLLTNILHRDCVIVGLDRRSDVVNTCNRIVQSLSLTNIHFAVGDIAGYQSESQVDLVISLHACDTATDDAIAQAVFWNANVILAVPCCQHELQSHLSENAFPPLTNFGIARERLASLATDTLRTTLLSAVGYQTQLLEFIETEHTPKNLLIRAFKRQGFNQEKCNKEKSLSDLAQLSNTLGLPVMTLERKLIEQGSLRKVPVSHIP